ncbi:Sec-independent protein translocase subunit TatA [Streptomyces sp. RY43-2]|uniref:Sec-independent protein translocase subunit TatA n=1 Tax=Streptomyces macrolidinus TaxID=2952607 RepID=A0ABT0ZN04_9ACTN|nr:Sec-independent protein translocase subunit TatA [Streptomyces macrolidinus]MCN9244977.1 Sec-independent protein translocase subunit TatA [Streptomyces macrolidinus]
MFRGGLEPWHLLAVSIVIILLFGSKELPEAVRGLGKSMRILKSEAKVVRQDGVAQPSETSTGGAVSEPGVRVAQAAPGEVATPHAATDSHSAH